MLLHSKGNISNIFKRLYLFLKAGGFCGKEKECH